MAGRAQEVHLNSLGERQSHWLAERINSYPVNAIYSSPLTRCIETASLIARRMNLPVEPVESASEIDFGEWSGRDFQDLAPLPEWQRYNGLRSLTAPPHGESMVAVQGRLFSLFTGLCRQFPNGYITLVSHADVIKAALVYFLGVPLDFHRRFEISPGSLSIIALDQSGPRVLSMNETVHGM